MGNDIEWRKSSYHWLYGIEYKIRKFMLRVFFLIRNILSMEIPVARTAMLIFGILVLLLSSKLSKAQPHAYDQFTVDDGLPSNYVYRIAEDELGYLWAATENGLARFDGYEWKSYGLAEGLTGLDIYSMTILPSREIICGGNGMQPMLISKGKVRPFKLLADTLQEVSYHITNSYPPLVSMVNSASEIGDTMRYVEVFKSDSVIRHSEPVLEDFGNWVDSHFGGEQNPGELKDTFFQSFVERGFAYYFKGVLGVEKGVNVVGGEIVYSYSAFLSKMVDRANSGFSLTAGSVDSGVLQTWKSDSLFVFKDRHNPQRIGFGLFGDLFDLNVGMKSRCGDFWLATRSSGVVRISKQAQQVRTIAGTMNISVEGLASTRFGLIVADDNSNLYKYSDGDVAPYSNFNTTVKPSRFKSLKAEISGDTAIFIRDRKLYLISSNGAKELERPTGGFDENGKIYRDSIKYYFSSMKGASRFSSAIVGGANYIYYIDKDRAKTFGEWRPYYSFLPPSDKNATGVHVIDQHRLLFVEEDAKLFTRWTTDTLSIIEGVELEADRFLLGTSEKGVYLLDLSKDSVSCTHLFSCAPVKKIKVINREWWAATYSGVYRFSESGKIEFHLDKSSGLLTNETYDVDQVGDSILIATAKGLAIIPKGMQNSVGEPVDSLFVTWQNIRVDGVSRKVEGNALRLLPQEDNLELDFTLLHPNLDGHIEYEVQLSPIDEQPRTQRERSVRYASLSPGTYELYVKAILNDGTSYSLESPLHIEHLAPLWKRPWFLLLCAVALFISIYTYGSRRAHAINKRQQLEQVSLRRNSELQLEALRSQMNPHFIFNALGSIQYFIQTEAKDKADEYLGRFAKLMRGYLDGSKRNMTPLGDEMNMLQQYLELEMMRANSSFSYALNVDPKLSDHQLIPSMLLQPLVENAILHGLSARKDGNAQLTVSLDQSDDILVATVVDNGQGIVNSQKNKHHGHRSRASAIMHERIEALRVAGIADVDLVFEENSVHLSPNDPEKTTYPGVRVIINIRNIQDHV